ncbi:MAG: hypothetical protein VYE10_03920 [Candidatus Thermoplasmatota archaeon]|nr:hypothetical protein [Candidatus Thermoplasmatota archaeon]
MDPGLGRRRVTNGGSGERRNYVDAKQQEKPLASRSLWAMSSFFPGPNQIAGRQ